VVYLTGASASGKSTLSEALAAKFSEVSLFTYSKELAKHVSQDQGREHDQIAMRRESARLVTPAMVEEVDSKLIEFVAKNRNDRHVIIDSHAVTKEDWGFRVTPFSSSMLAKVAPDLIVTLYTAPEVTVKRIQASPKGRPLPKVFEADIHTNFQASVAITYSIIVGCPSYFLDSDAPIECLIEWFSERLFLKAR